MMFNLRVCQIYHKFCGPRGYAIRVRYRRGSIAFRFCYMSEGVSMFESGEFPHTVLL